MRQRQPRQRDKAYLGYIAALPCVSCLARPVEVAHVRMAEACQDCQIDGWDYKKLSGGAACSACDDTEYRFGKRPTGMSEKPDDKWCVSLCPMCHRLDNSAQHLTSERKFWQTKGIDVLALCVELQQAYPDVARAEEIIRELHS